MRADAASDHTALSGALVCLCHTPGDSLGSSPPSGDATSQPAVTLQYLPLKHCHTCCFRGRDTLEERGSGGGFSERQLRGKASRSCSRCTGWNRSRGPVPRVVHELENVAVAPDVTNPRHRPRHTDFPSSTPATPLGLLRRAQGVRCFAAHSAHPRGVSGDAFGGCSVPSSAWPLFKTPAPTPLFLGLSFGPWGPSGTVPTVPLGHVMCGISLTSFSSHVSSSFVLGGSREMTFWFFSRLSVFLSLSLLLALSEHLTHNNVESKIAR